jgi:PAS domain S-box-containing protein
MIGIGFSKLDHVDEGVYYVDKNRSIIFWNKKAEELSGYSKSECAGRRCSDNLLKHTDTCGREMCESSCPMLKTIHDGKVRELEVIFQHKNGEKVSVVAKIEPVYDSTGAIQGAAETFTLKITD